MKFLKFGSSNKFIVFLHGWGADKNSFLWAKRYFEDYSLIFVDFPGFGESAEPQKPYNVYDYVCRLKEILDQFYIEELVLVGHSFGGRVAIKFSFLFQNDYANFKLCLVDIAGLKPKRSIKYFFNVARYKFYKKHFPNSKKLDKFGSSDYKALSKIMKQTFVLVVNEDLSNYAKYIKCKTVIIWGEKDTETPIYMAKRLKKLIKNSKLIIIKNAGHFSFLDEPVEFILNLEKLIKEKGGIYL